MQVTPWLTPFETAQIDAVMRLCEAVFSPPPIDIHWRLSQMPQASLFVAQEGDLLIGFKAGYAIAERRYYSWLGGVHPDFRGQGIATLLAHAQHQWLAKRGYTAVETVSRSENSAMAHLNLKLGFTVEGTKAEPQVLKVLWSKRLA